MAVPLSKTPLCCSGALTGTVVQPPISSAHYEHLPLSHSSCSRKARLTPSLRPRHAPGFGRRPWRLWVATHGEAAQGFGMPPLRSVTGPRRLIGVGSPGSPLRSLNLSGFKVPLCSTFKPSLAQCSPICFKASLRYAFKPPPLPILAPGLEPALAPNQAFPITPPLSDLALASPLRLAR